MVTVRRDFVRVPCPTCQRRVAGTLTGDGLRLIKHLAPRGDDGRQVWCEASDCLIVRTNAGTWRLDGR